jgi:hypothetical protein
MVGSRDRRARPDARRDRKSKSQNINLIADPRSHFAKAFAVGEKSVETARRPSSPKVGKDGLITGPRDHFAKAFGSWLPFVWKASATTRAALCGWLAPLCEESWPLQKISARRAAGADSLQDGGVDALAILGCLRLDQHRRTDRAAMYQFKHRLWPIAEPDKIDVGRHGSLKSVPQ